MLNSAVLEVGGGCANIAFPTSDPSYGRRWLLGSVSDDPYDVRTSVVVDRSSGQLAYVATELRSLEEGGMASRGYVVAEGERARGVNQAGFAITWAFVRERDTLESGVTSGEWSRLALSRARSVQEALELLAQCGARNFSGAYFLADAQGSFAQVEIGREAFEVLKTDSTEYAGGAVNVNCYQSAAMRPYEFPSGGLDDDDAPNKARLTSATENLSQLPDHPGPTQLARLLADHHGIERTALANGWVFRSQGYSICNHGSFEPGESGVVQTGFGTVSAEIMDPVSRTMWYCYGWPCGAEPASESQSLQENSWGKFVAFTLDDLPAGHMTTPLGALTPLAVRHVDLSRTIGALSSADSSATILQ